MSRVIRQAEFNERIRLIVNDTLGREFAVYFEKDNGSLNLSLIRLPEGVDWTVSTFQEMVGVRDEAHDYLQENDFTINGICLNLENVVLFDDDPHTDE